MQQPRDTTGRYAQKHACDGCGKSVGDDYCTDDEVCGSTDGPGFFLCTRDRCRKRLEGKSVEERRAIYTARAINGRKAPSNKTRTARFGTEHPVQPVIVDSYGVHRFKPNRLVRWLLDTFTDMNAVAIYAQTHGVSDEDRAQLAQLIGYSVGGFNDLSYAGAGVEVEGEPPKGTL